MSWKETGKNSKNNIYHEVHNLKADEIYEFSINNKPIKKYTASSTGIIRFDCPINKNELRIQIVRKQ